MKRALIEFDQNIEEVRRIHAIYTHLTQELHLSSNEADDLLRAIIINTISALDRYIHEIVRIGLLEIFFEKRSPTSRFQKFPITAKTIKLALAYNDDDDNNTASALLASLEEEITSYFKSKSFQHPKNIKDALDYIWDEEHKWQKIAPQMPSLQGSTINEKQKYLDQRLILIVDRRNQIAHEADRDIETGHKRDISISEVESIIIFIQELAHAIAAGIP